MVMLVAGRADATTARALSNRTLAEDASVIVTGRCIGLRTEWEGRTLVTVGTVEVTEVLKGDPVATVTVALPGGIDANRRFPIAMIYPGAPQMAIGEDIFLFLGEGDGIASGLTVLGFSQGKFSIVDGNRALHDGVSSIGPWTSFRSAEVELLGQRPRVLGVPRDGLAPDLELGDRDEATDAVA